MRPDLGHNEGHQGQTKNRRADQIAVGNRVRGGLAEPGHRNGIAARFSQRGGEDLDDPETERDCRDLAQQLVLIV
jgi:hypothetical protein